MTSRTIGGSLDLEALRQLHRPKSQDEMRAAVVEMRARGMGDYEISHASGLAVEQVRRLLSATEQLPVPLQAPATD